MNSNNRKHRVSKLAALTLAASAFAVPAFAFTAPLGAGEGLDPAQQAEMGAAPVVDTTTVQAQGAASPSTVGGDSDPTYTYTPASTVGPLSRAEVREALENWRNAGILVPANEIGDTNETLAAREAFNEMQAEAITARWGQEAEVMAKARETEYAAQLARQEIEAVLAAAAREEPVGTAALGSVESAGAVGTVGNGLIVEAPAETVEPVLIESAPTPSLPQ